MNDPGAEYEIRVQLHAPLRNAVEWPLDVPLPVEAPRPAPAPTPIIPPRVTPPPPRTPPRDLLAEEVQHVQKLAAQLNGLVAHVGQQYEEMLTQMEEATIDLALGVVSKLLHQQVDAGTFPIEQLVRQALLRLPRHGPLVVKLNPADLTLLRGKLGEQSLPEITLLAEPSLPRGGCHAESGDARVLAELDEQLADIRRKLQGSLRHA